MRRLSLLVILCIVVVAGYVWRDRLLEIAPQWVADYVGVERAPASEATEAGSAAGKSGGKGGNRAVAVKTALATNGSLPVTRRTIGYIRPLASTTIASETVGLIGEISAKDGADVKAGDLLARLDDRVVKAQIAKDEAALARDQATLDNARKDLDRVQRLVTSGASTKQAGDDAAAAVETAEATVALDQATLTGDRVALSKTELRAPFDGKLGAFSLSLGSLVQAGTALVTITEMAPVYAEFSLPETDLGIVRGSLQDNTLKVEVKPSLAPPDTAAETGPVVFIDNVVDEASASFRLRALLSNDDAALWPGQSIDIAVTAGQRDGLVLVPGVAVEPRDGGSIVYLVKPDSTIEVRKVELALREGDLAGISGGLQDGDRVVVEGQIDLADGSAVRADGPAPTGTDGVPPAKATGSEQAKADPT